MSKTSLRMQQAVVYLNGRQQGSSNNRNLFTNDYEYNEDSDSFESESNLKLNADKNITDFQQTIQLYEKQKNKTKEFKPNLIQHNTNPIEIISNSQTLQNQNLGFKKQNTQFLIQELWGNNFKEKVLQLSKISDYKKLLEKNISTNKSLKRLQINKTLSTNYKDSEISNYSPLPQIKLGQKFNSVKRFSLNDKCQSSQSISSNNSKSNNITSKQRTEENLQFIHNENDKFRKLITDCDLAQNIDSQQDQKYDYKNRQITQFKQMRENIKEKRMQQELKRHFINKNLKSIDDIQDQIKLQQDHKEKEKKLKQTKGQQQHNKMLTNYYKKQSILIKN